MVRIRVCRLTQTWCLTSLFKSNNSSNWHHEQNELASRDTETKPGTLRSNDVDGNEDVKKKKKIGLVSKTTTLHVHKDFFSHFFARFWTTTTGKCLISRFMEYVKKQRRNLFLFLYLDMVPRNSTPGGFAYIWQNKWVGIIAIKTERTQIHLLSDVLVAVGSLDLLRNQCIHHKSFFQLLTLEASCILVPMRNLTQNQWFLA